jgi:hypothetical protein
MSAPTTEIRAKRDTVNPCIKCGWAQHMGIHQPRKRGTYELPPTCDYQCAPAFQSDSQEKEK